MKMRCICLLSLMFFACSGVAATQSYSIMLPPGQTPIANHLDIGGNTLAEVLPVVPPGSTLKKWVCAMQSYEVYTYDELVGGWLPHGSATLGPGEGGIFSNPLSTPLMLTFTGESHVPTLPWLPCGCDRMNLISRQTNGVGTFENITGLLPVEGSSLSRWDGADWVEHKFTAGQWVPSVPVVNIGESVFIGTPCEGAVDYKWLQPPEPATPTNIFYGWNEISMHDPPGPVVADDWVCSTAQPVTKIRWWGSFLGWNETNLPPGMPLAFKLTFWTDVPAMPPGFSHPGTAIHQVTCYNYAARFVGWDFDPRSRTYEACFLFEQTLAPGEYFYQEPGPTGTNIYWLSIAAVYQPIHMGPLWGWKTRPRDPDSPAPDDAVVITEPISLEIIPGANFQSGYPLTWPDPAHSWDTAFELIYAADGEATKWLQVPDLTPQGMDVNATQTPDIPPPYLLADDFLCTATGPITNITIWGSWRHDVFPVGGPGSVAITLSLHTDVPQSQSPTGYSMPGQTLWFRTFIPGQFSWGSVQLQGEFEGWWTPPEPFYEPVGDYTCFRYDFPIPLGEVIQEGSEANPVVYWLDVQAQPLGIAGAEPPTFGWKTCPTNWNDDACWLHGQEPLPAGILWNELRYPFLHPREGQSMDLAFQIQGVGGPAEEVLKWSQPPAPYALTNGFNGWNEYSVYGMSQIVADDWVCTNADPVTDIHWWGSFLGWPNADPPQMPDAFQIAFWTDVPQGPNNPFSHPGVCVHAVICTNFVWQFAGWDLDPRQGGKPEACFEFGQNLLQDEWFKQERGTNIYWISIAAIYQDAQAPPYPWGWKTRPRDPNSPAPDDGVRIYEPRAPIPGMSYEQGEDIWWPTRAQSWDLAFALTTAKQPVATNDFGDAPDSYRTLLASDGARHVVTNLYLGNLIDAEPDGQPNATATGDDVNNLADEDGVIFTSQFIPGEPATAVVSFVGTGYLSVWLDFGADGSWNEPGDKIFSDVPLTGSGTYNLAFVVPITAARGSTTFVRFRFSTQTNLNYYGQAPDGEVEDYRVRIEELDFGDAPDPTFPTLWANNGARHVVGLAPQLGVFMGAWIDSEPDGQPNANATGDDLNPPMSPSDEDGVTLLTPMIPGQPARVQVIASLPNCVLNAWIDFGADGSWASPGDQIANNLVLPLAGPNIVNFIVPPTAAGGGQVFARFRLSTVPNLSYTGLAPNGEVEDYLWKIDQLDYGDAPDPTFPTLLANNGARHVIGGLFLGAAVDAETDGQPNATATGDDLAGVDDEDGVSFPTALIANTPVTIQVVSSGSGLLQGWFDFNRNGSWADPGEQVIVNRPVVAGNNAITFFVPNAVAGKSYARFRLSTITNLTFVGQAPDGEVEDYEVTFYPLKWSQRPELGIQGVDVDNRVKLADDFLCTQSGPITDIHLWGSFLRDTLPPEGLASMTITLSIYADVPGGSGQPNPYSHPGQRLWSRTFGPGQYQAGLGMKTDGEWWHHPGTGLWQAFADTNLWQFDFYIPADQAFEQVANTIYWLGVEYQVVGGYFFGWKTTYMPWNDAACWFDTDGMWKPLLYGDGHPYAQLPPPDNWLNLAFALSTEELDWGDAPDPTYPTLSANNGARHLIVPGINLGHRIDAESDGQPNANATGDDLNPPMSLPDEDGVALPTLVPGQPAVVTVVASAPALLNAWIDFDRDGSWAQPTDHVLADVPLASGPNNLTFLVPASTVWGTNLIARFRLCTVSNLTYTGFAPDGEVEDYAVRTEDLPPHDLGDAPDSSNHAGTNMTAYPSGGPPGILASFPTVHGGAAGMPPFGPIHLQPWTVAYLGGNVTGEWEADMNWDQDVVNNINPAADRPDQDGADDGVVLPLTLPHCRKTTLTFTYTVTSVLTPPLFVNIWFDWNRDGDWNDVLQCPDGGRATEWAVQNQPVNVLVPGTYTAVSAPFQAWHPSLTTQPLWMRITLSEVPVPGPLGFSGLAGGDGPMPPSAYQYGETEDYYITDYEVDGELDFGDAPDPTYPTLLASNGARHYIIPGFSLGLLEDGELNGLPHPLALGDDLNNQPDEDGVQIVTPWLIGTQACVNVTLTSGPGGGVLDGWVDFNANGSWEVSEQVFVNQPLVPGPNPGLCFPIPCTAKLGTNFARFRLTSAGLGGLGPTGLAQDGEVEDYLVVIGQPRPTNNIVVNYITVTNLVLSGTNYQVATLYWNAQDCIHYQLLQTLSLGTNNGTDIVWTAVGPEVIGPANSQAVTNLAEPATQRYYRILAP